MNENEVSSAVIGAAIDVHKELGPGLVEKIYEEALCHELHLRGLKFLRQRSVPISYKGVSLSVPLWLDLLGRADRDHRPESEGASHWFG